MRGRAGGRRAVQRSAALAAAVLGGAWGTAPPRCRCAPDAIPPQTPSRCHCHRCLPCSSLAPGVEYELAVQDCQPPHLFLIRKQYRASPGQAVALAYYYVLDGTIYQAPTLHAALSGRMVRPHRVLLPAFGC